MPERAKTDANRLYFMEGALPGPVLVVIGSEEDLQTAARGLERVPSLSYLRGRLELQRKEVGSQPPHADFVVQLPACGRTSRAPSAGQLHWTILAHATRLGMISGRGVPARHLRLTGAASA